MNIFTASKGFTLVEIIVVISIIALMTGAGLASYTTFSKQSRLSYESKKLADTMELAKRKALAGDGSKICSDLNPLLKYVIGYQVLIGSSETSIAAYSMHVICGTDPTGSDGVQYSPAIFNYDINAQISIINAVIPISVEFSNFTGAANFKSGTSPIVLSTSDGKRRCVAISPIGVVTEMQGAECDTSQTN